MSSQFDVFNQDDSLYYSKPDKAIWEYDVFDEKQWGEVGKWLVGEKNYLIQESRERFRRIESNLALYRGIQYHSQNYLNSVRDQGIDRQQVLEKIVCNHVYDLVNTRNSRLIKYKPGLAVLPTSNELEDKVGSKIAKNLIDNVWYNQEFEAELSPEFVKLVQIMGECYLAILWDKNAGPIHEELKPHMDELNKKGYVELSEKDDEGNPVKVDKVIKYGDTVYKIWYTLDILLQQKQQYRDVEYMYKKEAVPTAQLKKEYPNIPIVDPSDNDVYVYDYEKMMVKRLKDHGLVWYFYHKKTPFMPTGADIKFIGDKIVSVTPRDSSSGDLPVERMTDIDLPGQLHGISSIENVKGLTGLYNNLTNLVARNQIMVSHPKWVFPEGSVKKESLGNDITLVSYKGPVAPQLQQQNPTPAEIFTFRDQIKEEFTKIFGIGNLTGDAVPPPGVKSGVAMQFLSELETERFNEIVLKYSQWQRKVGIKTLERCSDHYENDDKRMLMVMGRNNKWMTEFLNVKYLSRQYDVRIQNSSALPQNKAAKTQYLLDLNEQFPKEVSAPQVLDMLDFAQPEKFMDYATVSVRAAEAENEEMIEGAKKINDPQDYEDHIMHWQIHAKQMREWSFKNQTAPEIQEFLKLHVTATEMLMLEKGKQNPAYMEQIMALQGFPIFMAVPVLAPPAPPEALPPEMTNAPAELPEAGDYGEQGEPVAPAMPTTSAQLAAENALPEAVSGIQPQTVS